MFTIDYPFVQNFLTKRKNIIITTHKTPDGDALGSSLALFHALNKDHNVKVIVPNEYPHYLKWLPGNDLVMVYEGSEVQANELIGQADLLFCLDFNKIYRVDTMTDVLTKSQSYKIMIDHHQEPDNFCDQILSDSSIASTAELMYDFLTNLSLPLQKDIAVCLYTGIITDTGSLKYPNVTQKTHKIVSELMSYDIDHSSIHSNLFDKQNKSRLKLLRICLDNLQLLDHQNTAFMFLEEKDLLQCNYQKGDTEGFVNMPLSLNNINFSAFFIAFKDGVKMSFRSKNDFDVNLFAKQYFNGGGHKNASGGVLKEKNMDEVVEYFKQVLDNFLHEKK